MSLSFRRFVKRLPQHSMPSRRTPGKHFSRPRVEPLEDRTLPSFAAPVSYPVGNSPFDVTVGDFNGDTHPDLATANRFTNDVSVLLGNPNGTFQAATHYPTGSPGNICLAIAKGDFNNDGNLDIVAGLQNNQVAVFLGNGNGTFQTALISSNGPYNVDELTVGDLNNDGKLDLAVSSYNGINVLRGNGNGTFQVPLSTGVGAIYYDVVLGHFNTDSNLDLAAANDNNTVNIFIGNGSGTFQTGATYAMPVTPYRFALADLNTDGKPDLAVANLNGSNVSVLLGAGGGTFQPPVNYPTASLTDGVTVADFNSDNKLDLAVTVLSGPGTVGELPGNGDGTFGPRVFSPAGSSPIALAAADFNHDNKPDLAVVNRDANTISVLINTSSPPVNQPPTDLALSPGSVPENSATGTTVGTFTTTDPDAGDTHTYTLVTDPGGGAGGADNASFTIVGNTLQTTAAFDFETKSSYSIRVRTTDAGGLYFEKNFTISVENVNEAPVNSVPGPLTTPEDTDRPIVNEVGLPMSIADVDAGGNPVQVNLSVTNGTLTLGTTAGLNFNFNDKAGIGAGDGTADAVMNFRGTLNDINTALGGMYFSPNADYNGSATLQVITNDRGNTGSGGPLSDADTVAITVTEVNDRPVAADDTTSTAEDTPLTFEALELLANDSPGPANESSQPLAVVSVSATSSAGGTVVLGEGGTITYTPPADFHGEDRFSYVIQDNGTTNGIADPKTDTGTVTITVTPVNDAPVADAGGPYSGDEDSPIEFTGSGTDVDEGDTLTYSWDFGDGTEATPFSSNPNATHIYANDGTYTAMLTVKDSAGAIGTRRVTVTVNDIPGTSDIRMVSAVADGGTGLTVTYEVLNVPLTGSFDLGFYRSDDALFGGDVLLDTVTIGNPDDWTVGVHEHWFDLGAKPSQVSLPGVGVAEVNADYHLLVVADPTNAVTEDDGDPFNEDNTALLTGAYHKPGGDVFVHGGLGDDDIRIMFRTATATRLMIGGVTLMTYTNSDVDSYRIRSHAGADQIDGAGADEPLTMWGGDDNDTLTGGNMRDEMNGGAGTDTLIEAGDHAVFTLSDTQFQGDATPNNPLDDIEVATLTGGPRSNVFDVSGWTGIGSLAGGGGADTVKAIKNASMTLTDDALTATDTMNLNLFGIGLADLRGRASVNTFTVSGWTGGGWLRGGNGADVVVAVKNTSFTLTDNALSTGDGMSLKLASVRVAHLNGGAGDNSFIVGGWTGTGSLAGGGGGDYMAASKNRDFTLTDTGLSATDGMSLSLTGMGWVNLFGGAGNNTFTVSGWTGGCFIDADGGTADKLLAVRDTSYTLANNSLITTDGMTLSMTNIEKAELTGGVGDNTFDVSFWTGSATLDGGGGTNVVSATRNISFVLTDSSLTTGDGMNVSLANIRTARLGGVAAGTSFTVSSWTGSGQLTGMGCTVRATKDADMTLSDVALTASDGMSMTLVGIAAAALVGGSGENRIDASAFTGVGNLIGLGGNDILLGGSGMNGLNGGGGDDVLVGGGGNDSLGGDDGNDVLIGGVGADQLYGLGGGDLLIAGSTSYDNDLTALGAIRDEWTSSRNYATRVANLRGVGTGDRANGNYFLQAGQTVFDDAVADQLTGGDGRDWFFAIQLGGVLDQLVPEANELVDEL